MREFEVYLGLKNGEVFRFIERAKNKEEIIGKIKSNSGSRWFRFVTKEYVKYQVLKTEIVSVGISMTSEEIEEYEKSLIAASE